MAANEQLAKLEQNQQVQNGGDTEKIESWGSWNTNDIIEKYLAILPPRTANTFPFSPIWDIEKRKQMFSDGKMWASDVVVPQTYNCDENHLVGHSKNNIINPCPYYHSIPEGSLGRKECFVSQNGADSEEKQRLGSPVLNSEEAFLLYRLFNMDSISCEIPLWDHTTLSGKHIHRSGDICSGIYLVNPKNVTHVDILIGNVIVMRFPYEAGKNHIRFYNNGLVILKSNYAKNDTSKIVYNEITGIPLISLMNSDVIVQTDGSVDDIIGQFIFVKKEWRHDLAANPGYFSLQHDIRVKYQKGSIKLISKS